MFSRLYSKQPHTAEFHLISKRKKALLILFFYGEDTYRLKQKIKELKQKFIDASLGDTNLSVLAGDTAYPEITRQILAMPFLAKSRLVIMENFLAEAKPEIKEKVLDFLVKIPETTVLVFAEEGVPDRRTAFFKKLTAGKGIEVKVQEFKKLAGADLEKWIKAETEKKGGSIDSGAVQTLIEYIGPDLWRMANELDKLLAYQSSLSAETVKLLVRPQIEANVFNLIDAVGAKNRKKSIQELHALSADNQNELYILSMVVYQFRNLLVVRDFMDRGVNSHWDIAKKAGLHPFVAQKTFAQAKNYTLEELKAIYELLLSFDLKMKTGQINPKIGIDLLVVKLCQ